MIYLTIRKFEALEQTCLMVSKVFVLGLEKNLLFEGSLNSLLRVLVPESLETFYHPPRGGTENYRTKNIR